jgi:uncharacterized glyoxalase superfamily protein PhnB
MHREDQFIPELIVRNGPAALDFYKSVFGAEEVHRMMKPGSEKLMHGELTLDEHKFFVCDEFPPSEGGTCKSPETLGGTGVRITLLVDDADGIVGRAVAAGTRVTMPVRTCFGEGVTERSSTLSATSGESTNNSKSKVTKRLRSQPTNFSRNQNSQTFPSRARAPVTRSNVRVSLTAPGNRQCRSSRRGATASHSTTTSEPAAFERATLG